MAASKPSAEQLITDNIDVWTSAIKKRGSQGRGSNKKIELYGIKKLRELILELAVRGLLVPQDPNDEPASVLLEKIAAEKEQLIKDGKAKEQKPSPEITEEDKPFALPNGWQFSRFCDVLDFSGGSQPPKSTFSDNPQKDYVQLIQIRDLGPYPQPVYVPKDLVSKFCTQNDVMIGRYGASVGKVFWGKDGAYNVALIKMHNNFKVYNQKFLHLLMLSPVGQRFFTGMSRSAQAGFSKADIAYKVLPIVPEEEQPRIAAKVDELMALCDQLEQQAESSLTAHQTLVETLLNTLLTAAQTKGTKESNSQSNSNQESSFGQAWNRIAQHFDVLFTTEHSIDQLKQTILQLAVMGKLVPQDPSDEPASVLLEKIAAEKEQLIKDKKIKKQKPLPPIGDDEKPFEIPSSWEWVRIGDLLSIKNGYAFKSKYFCEANSQYTLTTPGNFFEQGGFRVRGSKTKFYDGPIEPEFIFEKNDLIIPMTEQAPGLLGSAAFIPDDGSVYIHNQRLGKLTQYDESITKEYLYLFFNAPYLRKELASTCTGTTVRHTSPDRILNVLIPVMSKKEQLRIEHKVQSIISLFEPLKIHIRKSLTTRIYLADAMAEQTRNKDLTCG
jgi:type I restriction enzyme S subunit